MTCPKANAISIPGLMSPVSTPPLFITFYPCCAQMFPPLPSGYPFCVTLRDCTLPPLQEETVEACNRGWGNYYPFKIDTPARISDDPEGEKMACIPVRNRNTFSYQASLPRTISLEIPIGKANILTFHQETQEPRPASQNSIGKSRNSPFKRCELYVGQATKEQ
ncbi:hypothetical protein ALC62_06091 [Cyphomyrmex costatus]|uniref:Uncharacterized protein n=1 Tax=Cyphomyrmex costatus TaxID=456900 RepID=A0A195CR76_9HYME|nr:hypothetical protein ALC62_06091 [Cyphomyrmex costatus]